MLLKVIAVAALAVAVAVAVIVFSMPAQSNSDAPNVKFTEFAANRQDIRVGESTRITFNVQNLEPRAITDARMVTVIEPSGYEPYLTIDQPTVQLPDLRGTDSRTGQMQVTITAASVPAIEAVYTVKGMLFAEGMQTDIRQFELTVRQ